MSKLRKNTKRGVLLSTLAVVMIASIATTATAGSRDQRGSAAKQKAVKYKNLKTLPKGHSSAKFKNNKYYINKGRWYRKSNGLYIGVRAPIGAFVFSLPVGYTTLSIGSNRYYYLDDVYYRRNSSGYVVVGDPAETQQEDQVVQQGSKRLIVYPAAGQSSEETSRDKFECYEWATSETHYDPVGSESDLNLEPDFRRAMAACLEAKNYVVK